MSGVPEVGQQLPARAIRVDRATLIGYAAASGDHNPLHWDERFAVGVGLPDVIAHGMFTMGAAVQVVTDWVGDPTRVLEYGVKFVAPVVVPHEGGALVDVGGVVTAVDASAGRVTVELTVTCGGRKVLGRAVAVVATAGWA